MWTKSICGDGKIRTFDECLADRDHPCFDLEIREALYARERYQDVAHTGTNISTTALLGCLRSTYLERVTDYAAEPKTQWWSLRGQLIHKIVERPDFDNPYEGRRSEKRLFIKVGGVDISGQLDVWRERFLADGLLKDWKSVGDNGLRYIIQEGAKWEHIWQTNIYRALAIANGYRVDKIEIVYMSLMDVVTTGHEAVLHEYLVNEPKNTGFRMNMKATKMVKSYPSGKNKWACYYDIPAVPIYTKEQVMEFIAPKAEILHRAYQTGEAPGLPGIMDVDPKDRHTLLSLTDIRNGYWKCNGYCNVWAECQKLNPGWDGPKGE